MADARLSKWYRHAGVAATAAVIGGAVAALPLAFGAPSISGQEATVRQLESEIAGLDARYAQADTAYRAVQARVDELTQRIAANGKALAKAKKDFETAQVTLGNRLSVIYRQPEPSQMELLLRAGSFSEAIASVQNMDRVQRQDGRTIVRIRTARAIMAQKRKELISDRKDQVVARGEAKTRLAEITGVRSARRAVLVSARGRLQAMIAAAVQQQNAARAAALRAAQAQVNDAISASGGGGNSGGSVPVSAPTPPSSGGGTSGDVAAKLRQIALCESGGNPTAVSPSGLYRGKYQFDPQTWASLGGSGTDPAAASEAEQDRVAGLLYQQRGAAPWPVCGR